MVRERGGKSRATLVDFAQFLLQGVDVALVLGDLFFKLLQLFFLKMQTHKLRSGQVVMNQLYILTKRDPLLD